MTFDARGLAVGVGLFAACAGYLDARGASGRQSTEQAKVQAAGDVPRFKFDPTWPKLPLPNKWLVGQVSGVDVDSKDHVWMIHRTRTLLSGFEDTAAYETPEAECCVPAPGVIEFDQQGNVVQAWGGPRADEFPNKGRSKIRQSALAWAPPAYQWPEAEHTIYVDSKDHVWVGNNEGSHILKFTRDGKLLLQVGRNGQKNKGSNDTGVLNGPAGIAVDAKANEVFVADGYNNRRVVVFDADTGAYKRHWGAYGKPPDDSIPFVYKPDGPRSQQFNSVHCLHIGRDDLVYVCDRGNSRIQVFRQDGTFVKEALVAPRTLRGSVFDIAFSADREQRFLYVLDGRNSKVWILRRSDLEIVGSFGSPGHWGGGLTVAHNIAVDSKGNVYISEVQTGQRVQRFLYQGVGSASNH